MKVNRSDNCQQMTAINYFLQDREEYCVVNNSYKGLLY